jgi:hypothetical protein
MLAILDSILSFALQVLLLIHIFLGDLLLASFLQRLILVAIGDIPKVKEF